MKSRASTYSLCLIAVSTAIVAAAAGLNSCANPVEGQPVPFIPGGSGPAFYWPIATAVDPTGTWLYVASSNFDREFTSGWLGKIPTSLFDQVSDGSIIPIAATAVPSATVDTFAGTMLLVSDAPCTSSVAIPCYQGVAGSGSRLFVTSRANALVSQAALDPVTGNMLCQGPNVMGSNGAPGCSYDSVYLTEIPSEGGKIYMTDPFAMTVANVILPGTNAPEPTLMVTNLSPAPSGSPGVGRDAQVVFMPVPQTAATAAPASTAAFAQMSFNIDIGAIGANSLAYEPDNGNVYVGGCFVRIAGETNVACLADSNIPQYHENPLRFFNGNSGFGSEVQTAALGTIYAGGETEDIKLSSDGTKLYVATTVPNALVVVNLPTLGGNPTITANATVPLANVPNQMLVVPRPCTPPQTGNCDLIFVTAADPTVELANSSAFLVVDPTLGTVVADVEPVGGTPYGLSVQTKTMLPTTGLPGFRAYVALFSSCGVAAIDVPAAEPQLATVVSRVGSCP